MLTSSDLIPGLIHSARLCSTGYKPPRYALDDLFWFTKGCQQVQHIKASNHDAFLLQSGDHYELIFSSVARPYDWMQSNLQTGMIDAEFGDFKLYPGFLEEIKQLLPKILRLPQISDMPLYLQGHSLGGSLYQRLKNAPKAGYQYLCKSPGNISAQGDRILLTNSKQPISKGTHKGRLPQND